MITAVSNIEGFWIKNFGPLRNIAFGTNHLQTLVLPDDEAATPDDYRLGPVTLIVGRNDVGKSTLMDAFHFLADALVLGVDDACLKRGGYDAVHSLNADGPISFGINFRLKGQPLPLTYAVSIGSTKNGTPLVESEVLVYRSDDHQVPSIPLMLFQNAPKQMRHLISREGLTAGQLSLVKQTDFRHLGLAVLGELSVGFPDATELRDYLQSWYLGSYTPHDAMGLSPVVPQRLIHRRGDSLVNAVREQEAKHRGAFQYLLDRVAGRLPEIEQITYEKTESGRILLFFKLENQPRPLPAQRISDGMLRLFSHLLLLEDSRAPRFAGFEEPENGLDRQMLERFVESLITQVTEKGMTQFFITTHSENLIDRVRPESVWLLDRFGGETRVRRATDDPIIRATIEEAGQLPEDWFSRGGFMTM